MSEILKAKPELFCSRCDKPMKEWTNEAFGLSALFQAKPQYCENDGCANFGNLTLGHRVHAAEGATPV